MYEYYHGKDRNVYGSIISSYGPLNWKFNLNNDGVIDVDKTPKSPSNIQFCYILFYNHIKCRIDRYVLNTSVPFEVKLVECDKDSKFIGSSLTVNPEAKELNRGLKIINKDYVVKYVFREDLLINKRYTKAVYTNNGKLSKNFILYFIYEVCHSIASNMKLVNGSLGFTSYSKVYDLFTIIAYENRLRDLNLSIKNNNIHNFFPLDPRKNIYVNIHTDLLHKLGLSTTSYESIGDLSNIKFSPLTYHDGPQVIKDIRRMLKQAPINSNTDLDRRITKINEAISPLNKGLIYNDTDISTED